MLVEGAVLQERYKVLRAVGHGGMGAVYMAKDLRLGNVVALKENFFNDEKMFRAFEHEARLLAGLRHVALPKVFDHFSAGEGQFLVMEYIYGDDFVETLEKRRKMIEPIGVVKPFEIHEIMTWAEQLLDALDYIHTQQYPIIHRDIKPQNLKLARRNQITLLDFGLAKGNATQTSIRTSSGSVVGYTPNYAPIEQIQGAGTDPRTDLYSLGATFYHLITGFPPIGAAIRAEAFLGGEPDPLRAPHLLNPKIPTGLSHLLMSALEQHRNNRPPSAAAMLKTLRAMPRPASDPLDASKRLSHSRTTVIDLDRAILLQKAEQEKVRQEQEEAERQKQMEAETRRRREEADARRQQLEEKLRQVKEEAEHQRQLEEQAHQAREEAERLHQQEERARRARQEAEGLRRELEEQTREAIEEVEHRRLLEDQARQSRADSEQRRQQEERWRRTQEAQAHEEREAERRQQEEQQTREEIERRQQEEQQTREEIERRRQQEEQAKVEAARRRQQEEQDREAAERQKQVAEQMRQAQAEAERQRQIAEQARLAKAEAERLRQQLEEQARKASQEAERRRLREEEARQAKAEAERLRQQEQERQAHQEAEKRRLQDELEKRARGEAEMQKALSDWERFAQQEAERKRLLEEQMRQATDETLRLKQLLEEQSQRATQEAEKRLRLEAQAQRAAEEADKRKLLEEQARRATEEAERLKRLDEERKYWQASERQKLQQERARLAEEENRRLRQLEELTKQAARESEQFKRQLAEQAQRAEAEAEKRRQLEAQVREAEKRLRQEQERHTAPLPTSPNPELLTQTRELTAWTGSPEGQRFAYQPPAAVLASEPVVSTPLPEREFFTQSLEPKTPDRTRWIVAGAMVMALSLFVVIRLITSTSVSSSTATTNTALASLFSADSYVPIRPGTFMMGATNGEMDEKPVHKVTLTEGFEMGKYEVTQEQWEALMGNNPSKARGTNLPVENVYWVEVKNFMDKLNKKDTKYLYRLPTEAEWEYACRAGSSSDTVANLDAIAWYEKNADNKTHSVGGKQPNAWGLYDMHGNVFEYCQDWYLENYYASFAGITSTNPVGPSSGSLYATRGSACTTPADKCRPARRQWMELNKRDDHVGFRLLRQPRPLENAAEKK
ncbi:MAG: SUMF1/EgtB/PvdO family nonheme iron enzyme [Acidobacteria bacterium]|nr:SUMF1/EgtB/PvdO family nonheme iron enzyme [Acidobacteriota bacterium]